MVLRALAVERGDGGERGLAAAEARGGRRRGRGRGATLRPHAVARLYVADHLPPTGVPYSIYLIHFNPLLKPVYGEYTANRLMQAK